MSRARTGSIDQIGVDIAGHGIDRLLHFDLRQIAIQPVLRRLHQRTMERCADRKQLRALGAALVGEFRGTLDSSRVAGDHDLLGRIDVGWRADFALRRIGANGRDFFQIHAENRGHGADSHRHRFLHVLAAIAHGAHGIGKAESSRMQRARNILPGCARQHKLGFGIRVSSTRNAATDTVRIAGCVISVRRSWSSGPSKQSLRQLVAERLVGFFEGLPRGGIFFGEIFAHADGLRALAGEEQCDGWIAAW